MSPRRKSALTALLAASILLYLFFPAKCWAEKAPKVSRVKPAGTASKKAKTFPKPSITAYTDNSALTAFELDGNILWTGSVGELRAYDLSKGTLLKRHKFAGDVFISYIYAVKALKGKVWVATDIGLFSLDKRKGTWDSYLTGKDLPEGGVEAMDADLENGLLWLAVRKSMAMGESGDIRLGLFDPAKKRFRGLKIGSDFVERLVTTGKDVWLLTSLYGEEGGRLVRFGKKHLLLALKNGVKAEKDLKAGKEEHAFAMPVYITGIARYGSDGIIALYKTEPLGENEGESKTEIRLFEGAKESTLPAPSASLSLLKSSGKGGLWAGDEGKVWAYKGKGWKAMPDIPALGKGNLEGILSRGKDTYFIVNTLSGSPGVSGIYSVKGKKVLDLSQKRELSGGGVYSVILKDGRDNFWIKSEAGKYPYPDEVTRFKRKRDLWDYMNRKAGFKTYREAYHDRRLVYVTEHGGKVRLWAYYDDREGKVSGLKSYAYDPKDGSLLPEPRLTLKLETTWTKDDPGHVSDIHRVSVVRETDRYIWVITYEGWVLYFDKNKSRWEVLPGKYSSSAAFTSEGVWFTVKSGIMPQALFIGFKDLETTVHDLPTLTGQKNVWYQNTGIAVDGGTLWASSGKTLVRFDPNTLESSAYTADAMEENASISYILPYGERFLILGLTSSSYEEGISDWLWVFDKEKGSFLSTGVSRYLKGQDFGSAFPVERHLIEGDRLWLGTSKGVFVIDLPSLLREPKKR